MIYLSICLSIHPLTLRKLLKSHLFGLAFSPSSTVRPPADEPVLAPIITHDHADHAKDFRL